MAFSAGGGTNDIQIKVEVDASGAVRVLDATGRAIEQVGKKAGDADKGFSRFQGSIVSLEAGLNLAQRAISTLNGGFAQIFSTLKQAEQVENLSAGFASLSASVGNLADEKLKSLQVAAKGLISDMDLMRQANQAVLLGIDDGSGKYAKAAESVLKLGKAMGVDALMALESFTIGTARQSKLWLDNLGIIIDVEKAYASYAKQIKVNVNDLSDEQKKLAFTAAAYDTVATSAAKLADTQDTAATAATRVITLWENIKQTFASTVSQSDDLERSLNELGTTLSNIDWKRVAQDAADLATALIAIGNASLQALDGVLAFAGGVAEELGRSLAVSGGLPGMIDKADAGLGKLEMRLQGMAMGGGGSIEALAKEFVAYKEVIEKLPVTDFDNKTQNLNEHVAYLDKTIRLTAEGTKALDDALKKETTTLNKNTKDTDKGTKTNKDAESATKKLEEGHKKLLQKIKEMTGAGGLSELAKQVADVRLAQMEGNITTEEASTQLAALEAQYKSTAAGQEDFNAALSQGEQAAKKQSDEIKKLAEDDLQKFQDSLDDAKSGLEDLFGQMGVMPEMSKLMTDGLASMFPETMAAAGEYMPYAQIIIGGLDGALNAYKESNKPFTTGKQIGAKTAQGFIDSILGKGIGGVFSPITDAFGDIFGNAFGSNDWGTTMRRGFGSLFDDAFDALPHGKLKLWMQDEIKELDGLDTTMFDSALFESLSPDSQGIFAGLGTAFEQMVSQMGYDMEGFGSQITAILTNNVGGSLNNLQMMFEALEMSAEDLVAALENAFLAGDIGAKEFLASSAAINDLYTQGIPGAFGATGEAMTNLAEGGLQSGRIAMDAIGDIAAEATEKGITSFAALREDLIKSGHSIEDVDKFFQALAKNGIDSIEELSNVSLGETAQIVSDLEDLGFGFEQPIEKADELLKKLNELEDKHVSTYVDVYYEEHNKPSEIENTTTTTPATQTGASGLILMAAGGILGGPTMVRRGVLAGEAGPEAVVPLERIGGKLGVKAKIEVSAAILRAAAEENTGKSGGRLEYNKAAWTDNDNSTKASFASTIEGLVSESDRYKSVLAQLTEGTLNQKEAGKEMRKLFNEAAKTVRQYNNAQDKAEWAIANRSEMSARQFARIMERYAKAESKMDALKDTSEPVDINQQYSTIAGAYIQGGITSEQAIQYAQAAATAKGQTLTLADAQKKLNEEIMNAWLRGEVSMQGATKAMEGFNKALGEGLPGFGDITGAINQIVNATSGAEFTAGLKNLGIEAKQAGKDIGDIQTIVRNMLGDEMADDIFAKAFKQESISKVEDLLNITNDTALKIGTNFANWGVSFTAMENSIKAVRPELSALLADIKEWRTTWTVDVDLVVPDGGDDGDGDEIKQLKQYLKKKAAKIKKLRQRLEKLESRLGI